MERRMKSLVFRMVMVLTIGATMYNTAWAQNYTAPPVTISKDKVKIDGQVFYSHVVLEKQTLYSISKAYNVSFEEIYKYNPTVEEYGLKKNDIIIIPAGDAAAGTEEAQPTAQKATSTPAATPKATTVTPRSVNGEIKHAVKWYEDLSSIASKYGVSEKIIMLANDMEDNKIRNNQVLIIPGPDATEEDFAKKAEEEELAQETDSTEVDEWSAYASKRVDATLILPFKATGSSGSKNNMDFYSGVLLAMKEITDKGIDMHLNVYDITAGADKIPDNVLKESDIILGPVSQNDITDIMEKVGDACPVVSPLDQKVEKLVSQYRNLIQAPSTQHSQFTDIANWLKEDYKEGDRIIVISEKGGKQNDAGTILQTIIERNQIEFTPFIYSILEGRGIQAKLEAVMTKSGANRVVLASESEAFVNDAVRNLNLISHHNFQVVLYSSAKIRNFETIEVDNLHHTSLHTSLTYNIDYDNYRARSFILRYRALFKTEPTQFAYLGYDLTKYFVGLILKYDDEWLSHLTEEEASMIQSSFKFVTNGYGGYINNGIRRIIFGKGYHIEVAPSR